MIFKGMFFGTGVLPGKILLLGIVENDKNFAYFRSGLVK